MMRNRTSILLALLGTTVLAVPAFAQNSAAPAEAAEEGQGLSDIVVTARRRVEPLQATPLAVSALDSRRLEEARVSNITLRIDRVRSGPRPNPLMQPTNAGRPELR